MADPAAKVVALKNAKEALKGGAAGWPLAFKLQPQKPQGLPTSGVASKRPIPKKRWWSHVLYRGPNNEPVKILYSKTKEDSEALAQQFLGEKLVGFDMEWPWDDWKRPNLLQNKIGLIQVATEDKVALFHIGLHTGTTTDDIIAPSLRKLIESPTIGKIGVGILNADFARISRYFGLKPKAAIELSHLHRLVVFGGRKPQLVSTKMTSLANQVEQHLGLHLYKGDVRTSDWSKPLSQEQITYAAGDAYAGVMLYHCMNHKRLQMKPTPPLPIHADKYLDYKLSGVRALYLEPLEKDGKVMTSASFFRVPTAVEDLPKPNKTANSPKSTPTGPKPDATEKPASPLDPVSQALYNELAIQRKALAKSAKLPEYRIARNSVLTSLARERPLNGESLLQIKGVGKVQQQSYGNAWIETISSFTAANGQRTTTVRHQTPDRLPALGTAPQLHTGLSFALADTRIALDSSTAEDFDDTLPSLDSGERPSRRRTSGQKRKRADSPTKQDAPNSPQKPQQRTSQHKAGPSNPPPKLPPTQPDTTPTLHEPLTPQSQIFRNKLLAFSKLVTTRSKTRPAGAGPIVSSRTLDCIARRPPQTREELGRVAGIEGLFRACVDVDMDLLEKIHKFAPVGR